MNEPLEDRYFRWLCAKVIPLHSDNYYGLLGVLHRTEFVWVVHGDHNRAADGVELRLDFLREAGGPRQRDWFELPASVLEVLIAFAKRANFQLDTMPVSDWFWLMVKNLGLEDFRRITEDEVPLIQQILGAFIWRTYGSDGAGGLFPLLEPTRDQRKVEIWYQFCDYVEDRGLL
jgi:hypothetical protein